MIILQSEDISDMKRRYNVGIIDDVTFTSLDYNHDIKVNDMSLPKDIKQCLFWGLGSDGTVGSTKQSIKIIGDNTGMGVMLCGFEPFLTRFCFIFCFKFAFEMFVLILI